MDPAVPKRMASFRMTSGRYALHPESGDLPIMVNGQPLTPGQVLRDGDAIQFGRVTLGYFEKATATGGSRRPVDLVPLADFTPQGAGPGATIPNAKGICQFCGVPFDRATGACACTVPADAGPAGGFDPQPAYAPAGYGPPDAYADQYAPGPDPYAVPAGHAQPAYGASAGAALLIALSGPYAGHSFPLHAPEIGVGRDPSQDISLSGDTSVSRRHARIISAPGGFVVRDEGSSNGTWVNGVRIQEQPLFPGDTLRIGHTEFRLEA
jgi:pSer/pThr/pTyr-binding forkhead associated (FHA) protein